MMLPALTSVANHGCALVSFYSPYKQIVSWQIGECVLCQIITIWQKIFGRELQLVIYIEMNWISTFVFTYVYVQLYTDRLPKWLLSGIRSLQGSGTKLQASSISGTSYIFYNDEKLYYLENAM